jgi:hypothetical protein
MDVLDVLVKDDLKDVSREATKEALELTKSRPQEGITKHIRHIVWVICLPYTSSIPSIFIRSKQLLHWYADSQVAEAEPDAAIPVALVVVPGIAIDVICAVAIAV